MNFLPESTHMDTKAISENRALTPSGSQVPPLLPESKFLCEFLEEDRKFKPE